MRDKEFISGQLDTGFIERFNIRQGDAAPAEPSIVEADMAIVAGALEYLKQRRHGSISSSETLNRWKLSGRNAALNARQELGERIPSAWRKL